MQSDRKQEIFQLLLIPQMATIVKSKPESRNSIQVSHTAGRYQSPWAAHPCLPRHVNRKVDEKESSQDLNWFWYSMSTS